MAASEPVAEAEILASIAGPQLLTGLRSALAWLEANREQINDLNVFPVPDGDTGSNMFLTLRSALEEAQRLPDHASAPAVMKAAAHGSLMGARGNSGVILSQILRGFAQGLGEADAVDGARVAAALGEASSVAYRAVMKPTEGTLLTVVREAAAAAQRAAQSTTDIRVILGTAVAEAHAAVERTTDQLAVLREAGVVDAGGFGLAVILEGFARSLEEPDAPGAVATVLRAPAQRRGEPSVRQPGDGVGVAGRAAGAAAAAAREGGFGYCTEFLVHGPGLDLEGLRTLLTEGADLDSALVVGDAELIRVHIHAFDPAAVIARAAQQGRLSKLKVEDMTAQHHDVVERAGRAEGPSDQPRKPLGVVAVAPGEGFRRILTGLGSDVVVEGGQTMNPSIEDLLKGVRAADAEQVILLPNNGNVILTAMQVGELAEGIGVTVVPTRNVPQGISALLALDAGAPLEENAGRMNGAIGSVHAVEVTRAVRDSSANGLDIKAGDVIALLDDEITQVGQDDVTVLKAVLAELDRPPELVTVYRGAQVDMDQARELVGALRSVHPAVEFELHDGGQEHYPYVLSVE